MKSILNILAIFELLIGICLAACPLNLEPPPDLTLDFTCTTSPSSCLKHLKYRTFDGTCNNLQNPIWGAALYLYGRFAPPNYGDGISSFPRSSSGNPLPNARTLSMKLFGDKNAPDNKRALGFMSFGQLVAHDLGSQIDKTEFFDFCCDADGKHLYCDVNQTQCATIEVPPGDLVFFPNISCMNFVRSVTDRDIFCKRYASKRKNRPIEQVTGVSAYADLSITYGSSVDGHNQIRSYVDGKLVVDSRHGVDWPPQDPEFSTCVYPDESCFLFADGRANQNPGLTLFHIYFYQEHNRLAAALKIINPNWNDERLFQEARRINIAAYQQIVFYEYLPLLIGRETLLKNKIIYSGDICHINDYDSSVDASTLNEFGTGAFRFFHSQIEGYLDLVNSQQYAVNSVRLSDWFNRPRLLDDNGAENYELLGRGFSAQPEESADLNFDPEIKHFLFRRGHPFGQDLRAIDITRARDHGLASYNDIREQCGMKRADTWDHLEKDIPKYLISRLKTLYETPEDIELVIGGALEFPIGESTVGPTFTCVIANQFLQIRIGDRFFFENDGSEDQTGFSIDQLKEIKKASIARIYCDHVNNLQSIQGRAFELDGYGNPIVNCTSIPSLDLSKWRE